MTSEAERKQSIQRWALWLAVAIPIVAFIIYLLVWYGPDVIARHDVGNFTGPLRVLRLQQARDAARGRLLTLGAGLFAAGALIFTGRNYGVARRTLEVTEQGQVTDRYTRAIEQLGSEKLDVCIGSIYALERIARDSPEDHPTVMEVLTAFVREHSRERWPPLPANGQLGADPPERTTRPDVQAAVTVLGRRNPRHDRQPVDLATANLTGADLADGIFSRARLTDVDLTGARIARADLSWARLHDTNLTGARLRDTNLTGAQLIRANLTRADLRGADLTDARLIEVDLSGALWPQDVPEPEGWIRDRGSGQLARASTGG